MKKNIINISLAAGIAVAMASCSENYWNDHELDGFEEPGITDVQTIEYTLTETDYATLAANKTNKALAGDALAAQLKAVGTQCYFTSEISPREYVPALLSDPSFPYFTLTDGSAIKLTYRMSEGMPEQVVAASSAQTYLVTEADYQEVWESDNDFVNAFAPSKAASRYVPSILAEAYPDAEEGDLVVASYQVASVDPVFNAAPDQPGDDFVPTSVIGSMAKGDQVEIVGYVAAICANGFIVADNSGAVFVYVGNSFDQSAYAVGDQVNIAGEVGAYNRGLQITGASATIEVTGKGTYTYPAPVKYTGADLDNALSREGDEIAVYGTMTGEVSVSGNNINIIVEGAETAKGGVYYATDAQKALLVDGSTVTVTGYFIAIAGNRYCNFVACEITPAGAAKIQSRSVDIASVQENVMYVYTSGRWSVASDYTVLNHSDYQAMGQKYDNLSNDGPELYLVNYCKVKFPYAVEGDVKYVVYNYYASSATTLRCAAYKFDGSEWSVFNGVVTETSQFVMTGGKWIYDPNVTITLPAGKGIEISTLYYQTCVDWVAANIDKPTGATYVTSYGNNEYYTGASAYQGNVDLRAASARAQYAAGYEGMTDDEVVALMKHRFESEVFPAALSVIHPDANVIPGVEVIYTINFYTYTGTTDAHVIRYRVIGQGQFEFVDCDW